MAHAICPNGHTMWDGDGKPYVWAFRIGFIREYMKSHPDFKLGDHTGLSRELYDLVENDSDEDLDCWYCDECKGLIVFFDNYRFDYKPIESIPEINAGQLEGWDDYIALRDNDFSDFQEFYVGKNPIEAIEEYDFKYMFKVCPDKNKIYAVNKEGGISFGYYRSKVYEFTKD